MSEALTQDAGDLGDRGHEDLPVVRPENDLVAGPGGADPDCLVKTLVIAGAAQSEDCAVLEGNSSV